MRAVGISLISILAVRTAFAADYHVCRDTGDDGNNGSAAAPFKTILRAVKAAGAGDTVHLTPTKQPYRESVALNTHPTWYHPGGEAGEASDHRRARRLDHRRRSVPAGSLAERGKRRLDPPRHGVLRVPGH